jgi:hypothetical protein
VVFAERRLQLSSPEEAFRIHTLFTMITKNLHASVLMFLHVSFEDLSKQKQKLMNEEELP